MVLHEQNKKEKKQKCSGPLFSAATVCSGLADSPWRREHSLEVVSDDSFPLFAGQRCRKIFSGIYCQECNVISFTELRMQNTILKQDLKTKRRLYRLWTLLVFLVLISHGHISAII